MIKIGFIALCVLQGIAVAQTSPDGVSGKIIGTHQSMRLTGTHVIHGGTDEGAWSLMFKTDDLPEGKPMQTMVDLNAKPSEEQLRFLSQYSTPKTIIVTCDSVEVIEMKGAQTGKTATIAHGKKCNLDSLK